MPRRDLAIQNDEPGVAPFSADRNERRSLLELWRTQFVGRQQPHRPEPRFDIDDTIAEAHFTHPGGGIVRAEVLVIDLSSHAMCILHAGYLHPSTECGIIMQNMRGETRACSGSVSWCQFLRGRYHAVGVVLNDAIDLREFVDPKLWLEHAHELHAQEMDRLSGRALMMTRDGLQVVVVQMILSETELKLELVDCPGALTDAIHAGGCDLVIIDADLADQDAAELIARIRKEGYRAAAIAISASQQPGAVHRLRDAGFDEVLLKPLVKDELVTALHLLFHRAESAADGTAPIFSSLASSAVCPDWLQRYVDSAAGQARRLEECAKADDLAAATALCQSFKATGKSFGYEMLTEAAEEALKALHASCSPRESMVPIYRLIRVVNRLSPIAKGPEKAA